MKEKNNEHDGLLHCRNCDGYYDSSLPNCPHCGEETANNLSAGEESTLTVADYGGGFGAPGSAISRVAALLAGVLGAVALLSLAVLGTRALANMKLSLPSGGTSTTSAEDPADSSASADGSAEADGSASASTSAAPVQKEEADGQDEQEVVSPDEITLNYYDVTLPNSGETLLLEVSISPDDWEGDVTFTTDNKSVATITRAGLITNVGAGRCTITVSAGDTSTECIVRCKGGSSAGEGGSASITGTYSGGKLEGSDSAAEQQSKTEEDGQEQQKEDGQQDTDDTDQKQDEQKEDGQQDEQEDEQKEDEQKEDEKEQEEEEEDEDEQKESASDITLQYYDITLVHVGDGYTFSPSGGNGTYSWSSGNSSVASVTSGGTVTATGVGVTTITCTSGDTSVQVIVRVSGQ